MSSNPFDDEDDLSSSTSPVAPVASGSAVDDDDWGSTTPLVQGGEPAGLVSDEAKAAAKAAAQKAKMAAQARAKQAGQAASVAAAGLKTKFTELRGQSIGKTCKQVCAGIAVVAVVACAGIEWHAHRSIRAPEVAAAPVPVKVAPAVKPAAAVVVAPVVIPRAAPDAVSPAAVVASPTPVSVAPSAPTPVAAPVIEAKPVSTDGPMNHLKPKSFNPMSPDYKPAKTKWEIEQEQKLNAYFKKGAKDG